MRINKFIAQASGLSRRGADAAMTEGRVTLNGKPAAMGDRVGEDDIVKLDGKTLSADFAVLTILLNKPVGYVVSRNGQGSPTIYQLLPKVYQSLQPVGRLDKNSSGLLVLTNDGQLANELTHPSYVKTKVYEITLDSPLEPLHQQLISDHGVTLADGNSRLLLEQLDDSRQKWQIRMHEGRNRQIRRTFESLGYQVRTLHRTKFGRYDLAQLKSGKIIKI